ncbi:hypothetical protein FA95DRAFT_1611544 [Auriscalpium vulgare]|uniref:Uncharacterized protein n=1 Tax=Auriscalpium vulgare TaxID=40419 RepID=A0ACB8R9R9_9AGAM|nr:hypothetical protein FA95DRAFT_1611544 [Auriscalpium vulgare]
MRARETLTALGYEISSLKSFVLGDNGILLPTSLTEQSQGGTIAPEPPTLRCPQAPRHTNLVQSTVPEAPSNLVLTGVIRDVIQARSLHVVALSDEVRNVTKVLARRLDKSEVSLCDLVSKLHRFKHLLAIHTPSVSNLAHKYARDNAYRGVKDRRLEARIEAIESDIDGQGGSLQAYTDGGKDMRPAITLINDRCKLLEEDAEATKTDHDKWRSGTRDVMQRLENDVKTLQDELDSLKLRFTTLVESVVEEDCGGLADVVKGVLEARRIRSRQGGLFFGGLVLVYIVLCGWCLT